MEEEDATSPDPDIETSDLETQIVLLDQEVYFHVLWSLYHSERWSFWADNKNRSKLGNGLKLSIFWTGVL